MKLLVAIATAFAASAVAKYAPGQECRTNKGCDENCLGGKWSVSIMSGDARLVCDPTTLDSTRYVKASCTGVDDTDLVNQKRKIVCDKAKGKLCDNFCFLTTPASKEDTLTTQFRKLCAEQKSEVSGDLKIFNGRAYDGNVYVYPTKEQAVKYTYTEGKCDNSVFP